MRRRSARSSFTAPKARPPSRPSRPPARRTSRRKILVDVSNPLDFSQGMPPRLLTAPGDSLGEQIQRAFPDAKVVKALNTVNAGLMGQPQKSPRRERSLHLRQRRRREENDHGAPPDIRLEDDPRSRRHPRRAWDGGVPALLDPALRRAADGRLQHAHRALTVLATSGRRPAPSSPRRSSTSSHRARGARRRDRTPPTAGVPRGPIPAAAGRRDPRGIARGRRPRRAR